MLFRSLLITPIFLTVSRDVVKGLLLPGIIPFNLVKAGVNSIITFLLYKRVSGMLHR